MIFWNYKTISTGRLFYYTPSVHLLTLFFIRGCKVVDKVL